MSAKWRALPFPHPLRYRLAIDQVFDGHLTDNPNNAAPEPCWGDARQEQYNTAPGAKP